MKLNWFSSAVLACVISAPALADVVKFEQVTDNVYAFIGEIDDRTKANLGLNANIGLVVTDAGAVIIDTGAGPRSAEAIAKAAKKITDQKIVAVFNTGSQDHRWLGNDYFAQQGATIYAMDTTVATQQNMLDSILNRIMAVDDIFRDQTPVHASEPLTGKHASITIGGTTFEVKYFNDAHFPGDVVIWLPQSEVLFSGDHVYVDRLLGVHPHTHAVKWLDAFEQMIQLPAKYIVPGHGAVSDKAKVQAETGDYLKQLVEAIKEVQENFGALDEVTPSRDWSQFQHLRHFDGWHGRNVSNTFMRLEME
ncbi:beta-lactamase [Thiomicrospira aerophila AL3]|uniref:Beta-lactamase n=1 Tax=Thiomicrospira aerophila AL3 TaxID=717772 RepID=W0DXJ6_9GAMM|nr:MBL fold metallo-hydrolase [Thiomicrospira aerophila]AHF01689.1 beta-lactamase [Thiomicrospira aerophila AL3]